MKKLSNLVNTHSGCMAILMVVVVYFLALAISWLITCGIIKLITMCFGWAFSWPIATGVWLLMILGKSVFGRSVTVKK